ncbi:hypothetical protein FEM03_20325 [Phragmitibacter flavus]|uniref:Uncharacterized protein n=1 Tax=Phragmitibacter flavus TaxID=2576071 RepID=A0A5R8K9M7_9BACT|nr:hypothetical protein [Phragmitibacter flavus]TLD69008.1 hypothetical protein FEM03_20325 [Phragmitibacter flavus]
MNKDKSRAEHFWQVLAGLTMTLMVMGTPACNTTGGNEAGDQSGSDGETGAGAGSGAVDVAFLLSMNFDEARKISPKHLDMSPYCRMAADNIEVLRQTPEGVPLRVRATGRVFLEVAGNPAIVALGQEAYVDRAVEVILRGRPLMRRGRSLVEGLKDDTVFYVGGSRLQVIGSHRIHPWEDQPVQAAMTSGGNAPSVRRQEGSFNVTPTWRKSWQQGPNPLLPALSPEDIPSEMRASPLLPPPDEDDQPKLPGENVTPNVDPEETTTRSLGRRLGEEKPPRVRRVQ